MSNSRITLQPRRCKIALIILGLVLVCQSGCASIYSTFLKVPSYRPGGSIGYRGPRIYSGTRIDAELCTDLDSVFFGLIDIIPSAVFDTIFLPYTLVASNRDDEDKREFIENQIQHMRSEDADLRMQGIWAFRWIEDPGDEAIAVLKAISLHDPRPRNREEASKVLKWYERE